MNKNRIAFLCLTMATAMVTTAQASGEDTNLTQGGGTQINQQGIPTTHVVSPMDLKSNSNLNTMTTTPPNAPAISGNLNTNSSPDTITTTPTNTQTDTRDLNTTSNPDTITTTTTNTQADPRDLNTISNPASITPPTQSTNTHQYTGSVTIAGNTSASSNSSTSSTSSSLDSDDEDKSDAEEASASAVANDSDSDDTRCSFKVSDNRFSLQIREFKISDTVTALFENGSVYGGELGENGREGYGVLAEPDFAFLSSWKLGKPDGIAVMIALLDVDISSLDLCQKCFTHSKERNKTIKKTVYSIEYWDNGRRTRSIYEGDAQGLQEAYPWLPIFSGSSSAILDSLAQGFGRTNQ